MSLLMLHLSDIHLSGTRTLKEPDTITACLREITTPIENVFIVLSGDVAFSGQSDEYSLASEYLKSLTSKVQQQTGVKPQLLIIPGNHDCQFPSDSTVRDLVVQKIRGQRGECSSEEMLKQCLRVQDEFFGWAKAESFGPSLEINDRLCWTVEQTLATGQKVVFLCVNTAWLSVLHEQQGQLFFPIDKIPQLSPADLVVGVLHHPYNWFEASNARSLRRTLEEACDIILTGHEHESEIYKKTIQAGPIVDYLEGDVFCSDSDPERSGFNLIVVDLTKNRFQIRPYSWESSRYSLTGTDNPEWAPFVRNAKRKNRPYEMNSAMLEFLHDPGANLTHSAKTLELEDIYVTPNLRRFARLSSTEGIRREIVESEFVLNRVFADRYAYFSGEGYCGKTSMAKMLFVQGLRRGLVPVYVKGDQITRVEPERIQKTILSEYSKQYVHPDSGTFVQLPKENKIIILDDFFNTKLNENAKVTLCEWLRQTYGYLFVFGGDLSQVEEMLIELEQGPLTLNLIHYEIMEFGFYLREQLIERWLSLGKEHAIGKEELMHQVNQVERVVDTVLGKNLLPSYPIFVLVTLQQHEAGQELNTTTGAYGYFYDVLITGALRKTSGSMDDIDVKYNYLAELAWYLFAEKRLEIELEEITKFNAAHWAKYRLTGLGDQMLRELVASRILVQHTGLYTFQYKYIYYYFVARYIHNNSGDARVTEAVDALVSNLHREEAANILIFLTYLSRDRKLIDEIMTAARALFPGTEACDLDKDISFLNKVQDNIPQILLPDGDPISRRKQVLRNMDMERENNRTKEDAQEEKEREEVQEKKDQLNEILSLNRAFKSMQIMGQILRNFSGSLTGDLKLELAKECFSVGLRSLNAYLQIIEKNLDSVIAYTAELLGKDLQDMTTEERIKTAKQIVFFVTEMLGMAFVKRISAAVGSERLMPTYEDIERVYNNVATEFVQITIRMDHAQQFPEKRVFELRKALDKNVFGQTLLRMLVVDHLYLFPRPYKLQQRLCSTLEIKPSKQMIVGSPQRKRKKQRSKKARTD